MTLRRKGFATSLNWNLLKVFHQIVLANGITAASVLLLRKQSTISHQLKQLEDELGARLCLRGPSGFKLTDEGQALFEYCECIQTKIDEVPNKLNNLAEEIHGQLKLQTISNLVIQRFDQILLSYNRQYPFVELDISIVPWEGISKAVLRNQTDIGIAPVSVQFSDLRYDFLFSEVHRLYCSKEHHLFGQAITDFTQITNEPFVITGNDEPEQITKFRLKHGLGHRLAGISSHLEEAKRLTLIGAGICFLPEGFTVNEVKDGLLWPLTEVIKDLTLDIFIISHPQTPESLIRQYFIKEVIRTSTE
jgi:DNA-binding transcriptional LysR family regulator